MGRKKVNLQLIANDSSRRAMFNKRCKVLMKKASELATLCGVKVSVVVYRENEAQPMVWPSVPEATDFLTDFRNMPENEQWKKRTSHEEFLCKRIAKLEAHAKKSDHESRERETLILLHEYIEGRRPGFVGVTSEELTSLRGMVERKQNIIKERLQQLGKEPATVVCSDFTGSSSSAASPSAASTSASRGDMVVRSFPPIE